MESIEETKLQRKLQSLTRAAKKALHTMVRLHSRPYGALKRCPNHVSLNQSYLCSAISMLRKAISEKV